MPPQRKNKTEDGAEAHGHRRMVGYEVCLHTCGCKGRKASSLWLRDGGACARHAADAKLHPACDGMCPGQGAFVSKAARTSRTRDPTYDEIMNNLPSDQAKAELQRLGLASAAAVAEAEETIRA